MPPYRRGFAVICILIPLLYLYWERLTASDTLRKFRSWHIGDTEDVFNNTLGFSKIFVINLPSRTDRRDSIALAGAVSNLTFTWIDGISGDEVEKYVSLDHDGARSSGAKGSWRSHMNALQAIVAENLTSALVLEDDIDWDVRLKSQLQTYSSASRTWLRESKVNKHQIELSGTMQLFPATEAGTEAQKTAYGEGWDIQWLGHCGTDFPDDESLISPLRITISNDETVPAPKHLKPHPFAMPDKLGEVYPPHTRVVHASSGNVCSLAYAVSQQGARKLLSKFNAHYDTQWDLMLQKWCEGKYEAEDKYRPKSGVGHDEGATEENQEKVPICLTVQPPLFSHHYAKDGASNILGQGGGYAKGTGTPYIRLSVRQNLERLAAGMPESEMVDQLPDDGDTIWK